MKKYFSLISIILMLLLMACGSSDVEETETDDSVPVDNSTEESPEPENANEEETQSETEALSAIMENLDLKVAAEQQGTTINFKLQLINKNEEAVDLMFTSGQQFEIKLFQEDEVFYQYSEGKMFTEALVEESLAPGEFKNWAESWDMIEHLEPGEYEVEMTLLPAEINGQQVEGEPLKQTITITIEDPAADEDSPFRSVDVEGENGEYTVTGEVDTSVGVTYYEVEDGHNYLVEQTEIPVEGDGWQEFEIKISIDEDMLPQNGAVVMLLYTEDRSEQRPVQLEVMP
ncbi:BsuPI-related putative proteinase inhibitor [Gracilibacillus thailandensis]|uniref:Intracellular proteinase inhibitor BsuPI domain-containing protein n=1 Tax=Gracilibacillus thailandensis TaxID=563735 RepID=A0A6N7QV95_9BACI|nr:BsuPI-related putative proteinase inhibitor [Gracilibacillus thailandensis]MRI65072.1 hypothetical protein [Gracilibacillus thailandensis]